jgi:DNA primase
MAITQTRARPVRGRTDTTLLKQANPIDVVANRYGVELRRQGRAWIGRCPFHADAGRPNFYAYDTQSWRCYRCGVGGDIVDFVMRAEQVGFREAIELLGGAPNAMPMTAPRVVEPRRPVVPSERTAEERAVLQAATTLYHQRLRADTGALGYVACRGIDRATIERSRVGFAAGDELVPYLKWRGLPISAALSVGLLNRAGQEHFASRIVVPEMHDGESTWLIGRLIEQASAPDAQTDGQMPESTQVGEKPPKYLTLRGAKPLLGWESTRGSASVCVVEGVFDLLTLRMWGYPVVSLVGTYTRPDLIEQLRTFGRTYLVLDNDDAGLEATLHVIQEIGTAAVPVALPDEVKDVAELATRADGHAVFAAALVDSIGMSPPITT